MVDPCPNGISNTEWKILIIDDDEDDFFITREMLRQARSRKFDVHWASTYSAGREQLFTGDYHAVLVDYDLGQRSGIELIREANGENFSAPLILFTGRGNYEVDVEAMGAGATLYLTKEEVNPLLLERSIRYAIERKQIENQLKVSNERLSGELADRQRVEEQLRQQKDLLERLVQAAPAGIAFLKGSQHRYNLFNDAYRRIARGKGELLGRTVREVWPEVADLIGTQLDRVYQIGEPFSITNAPLTIVRDGVPEENFFTYTFTPITQPDGATEGVMVLAIETTDAVRDRWVIEAQNEAIRESEERFKRAIMSAPYPLIIRRDDGQVIMVNETWTEITGYTLDDIPTIADWTRKAYGEQALQIQSTIVEDHASPQGRRRWGEYEITTRSGAKRIWDFSTANLGLDPQGRSLVLSMANDVTERNRVERALRRSEEKFAKSFMFSPVAIAISTLAEGRFIEVNESYIDIFGYHREEVIGQTSIGLGMFPDPEVRKEIVRRFTASGGLRDFELRLLTKTGEPRDVLFSAERLDVEGQECMLSLVIDITKRKRAETALQAYMEKLKRSNQELEQFALIASHDLQEPLRKIMLFGDSLRKHKAETLDEEALDYLARMLSAAERMQTMVHGLLELSRVNRRDSAFTLADLNRVVEDVLSDLEPRIRAVNGQVAVGALPSLEADALQMRQLFQNLIGNAIKFHDPDVPPMVRVTGAIDTARKPHWVTIRVEDNGIGFEQEHAARIFQPFQRLHGRQQYEGTGLGLAICQKIVERHGGTISVESAPGKGTTFTIHLPLKPAS